MGCAAAVSEFPQPPQNFISGAFWCPQRVQFTGDAAGTARMSLPQFVQNALESGICEWQAGQLCVAGAATACTALPQCGQNFLPVTSLPQAVHVTIGLIPSNILLYRLRLVNAV